MAGPTYDPEVWFFLRKLWESIPKISYAKLVDTIKELTDKPIPPSDTVSKKSKKEKWQKSIRAYCGKSDFALEKIKVRLFDELKKEYDKIQDDKKNLSSPIIGGIAPFSGVPNQTTDIIENIVQKNRKIIDVLQDQRMIAGKLNQLFSETIEATRDVKQEFLEAIETHDPNSPEIKILQKKVGFVAGLVNSVQLMAVTQKYSVATEVLLYGIKPDDTRDADTDDRLTALLDDSLFNKEREELRLQAIEMSKRAEFIESGDFVEENEREILEAQLREDLEAEYVELNDDYSDE